MILTSPIPDLDQELPVTTTFDAPQDMRISRLPRRARNERVDWERVELLYSFVRDRSLERLHDALAARDGAAMKAERQTVHAIDALFGQARQGHAVVVGCAITFFRARARRDAQHPGFLGEWLGSSEVHSRSA
jgi:hypothetical protein